MGRQFARLGLVAALLFALPAHAFHVCPSVSDAPLAPPVVVTSHKAAHALDLVRKHLEKNQKAPWGQLKKLVEDYAAELAWVCRSDPQQCAAVTLERAEATTLRALSGSLQPGCIPEPGTEETGQVGLIRSLPAEPGGIGWTQTVMQKADGSVLNLYGDRPRVGRGKVVGTHLAGDLYVNEGSAVSIDAATADGWAARTWPTTGIFRQLKVLVAWDDSPVTETIAQFQAEAQWQHDWVAATSFGRLDWQSSVHPSVLTMPGPTNTNPFATVGPICTKLAQAGVDFTGVNHLAIVSGGQPWPYGGTSPLGSRWSVTCNGRTFTMGFDHSRELRRGTYQHEDGHSIGLMHANRGICDGGRLLIGGQEACTRDEYLRFESLMGCAACEGPYGAIARTFLGWLTPGPDIAMNPPPGTYTLVPVSSPGPGLRGLVWRRAGIVYGALELRQPVNIYEQAGSANKHWGLHLITASGEFPDETEMDLPPFGQNHPNLLVGEDITDPATGFRFRVDAIGSTSATVTVLAANVPNLTPLSTVLTAPIGNTIVSGTIPLAMTETGPAPWRVRWEYWPTSGVVSSRQLIVTTTTPPFGSSFDTRLVADGGVRLYVTTTDRAGQRVGDQHDVFASNGIVTTTTAPATTTTLDPNRLGAVLSVDSPEPSNPGQPVRICATATKGGAPVTIRSMQVNLMDVSGTICVNWVGIDPLTGQARPNVAEMCVPATCAYTFPCLPCTSRVAVFDGTEWSGPTMYPHRVVVSTATTTLGSTSTTATTSSTTSTRAVSTTLPPGTTTTRPTTSTAVPTTSTTRTPTTTTLGPTTTTLPCRPKGTSCVVDGKKQASICCSKRCGGARKCRP